MIGTRIAQSNKREGERGQIPATALIGEGRGEIWEKRGNCSYKGGGAGGEERRR